VRRTRRSSAHRWTASGLFDPERFAAAARQVVGAHVLAIASLPLVFLGMLALSRRLSAGDGLAEGALTVFGLAALAVVIAGTGHLNQAFAQVFVVASATAIALWSASIVRSGRLAGGIGVYGLVAAPLLVLGLAVGHIRLNVHGFGLVVLAEAIWYVSVGALLVRSRAQ
jgi:hypothetical protein